MMHNLAVLSVFACSFTLAISYPTANSNENVHPCTLPKQSGLCLAYFPSFYYNTATGTCETFIYGGCQGNANRFTTLHECMEKCGDFKHETNEVKLIRPSFEEHDTAFVKQAVSAEETNEQTVDGETKQAPAVESSPSADKSSQSAEEAGPSAEETVPSAKESDTADDCKLPAETGSCRAFFPRFYFNSGKCEQFTYGGCEGNNNNFKTIDECQAKCGSTSSSESATTSEGQSSNKVETST